MVRKLLGISELAILGVILFHTSGWGFTAMFAWTDRYLDVAAPDYSQAGGSAYYFLRLVEQLISFVIPSFLFVSGYFVAIATGRNHSTVSWNIVGARIRTLLLPYLFWTLVLWVFLFLDGKRFSAREYLVALLTGRTNPAYYYVPLLISFYLLSPLLVYWAKRHWRGLLIGAVILQSAVQLLYYPSMLGIDAGRFEPLVDLVPQWFFPSRIFWFVLGTVTGFYLPHYQETLRRYRRPLLQTVILLFVAGVIEWEAMLAWSGQAWIPHRDTFIDTLFALTVILCFLAFEMPYLPFSGITSGLSSKTYGIYLVHSPVMEIVARAVYAFAPVLLAYQFVFQPLIFITGLGVPLLLMALVNRSPWRGYARYLFG